jgi:hypothetical protein
LSESTEKFDESYKVIAQNWKSAELKIDSVIESMTKETTPKKRTKSTKNHDEIKLE